MGPLQGIRVVELGQPIAGPSCGQLFADVGAEAIKVEPPKGGDATRRRGRADREGRPIGWSVIARNKSLTLDLREPEGQDIVFPRLSETPGEVRHAGPELGADTAEILRERIGASAEWLEELRSKDIV